MKINFVPVTSVPRRDTTVMIDLTDGLFKPSAALCSSVIPNKISSYVKELTDAYTAENNTKIVKHWLEVFKMTKNCKTVYLLTHKGCEKWMSVGFKTFYKSIYGALENVQNAKPLN